MRQPRPQANLEGSVALTLCTVCRRLCLTRFSLESAAGFRGLHKASSKSVSGSAGEEDEDVVELELGDGDRAVSGTLGTSRLNMPDRPASGLKSPEATELTT
eukprot:6246836-Amphidinium_carterae.1